MLVQSIKKLLYVSIVTLKVHQIGLKLKLIELAWAMKFTQHLHICLEFVKIQPMANWRDLLVSCCE